jgi:membrane protein
MARKDSGHGSELMGTLVGIAALGAAGYLAGRAVREDPRAGLRGARGPVVEDDWTPERDAAGGYDRHGDRSGQRHGERYGGRAGHGDRYDTGEGYGRDARSPREMPGPAWRDILWRVKDEITRDRVMIVAGGVTFYAILSLVPMIVAFVSLYGLIADPDDVASLVESLRGTVPEEMLGLIQEQLDRLVEAETGTLGLTTAIGIAIALWSANGGVKGLIEAMNVAYDEREERSFVKLNLTAMSMTLSGMVMVTVLIALAAILPVVLANLPLQGWIDALLRWGRWPLMAALLVLALGVIYRYGPDRRTAQWRWISPGAVVAAIGVIVVSAAFSFYTSNFAAYGDTYGSLGAVIAAMMWLWLNAIVVIIGAEINAEIEHQTARDTTIGRDRPMGEREAAMADKVAPRGH